MSNGFYQGFIQYFDDGVFVARILSFETCEHIEALCKRYPTRLAALIPALHRVQEQIGYVSDEAALDVAELLDVPPTRVREVVSFYTMFHAEKIGKHEVKICRNLACRMRGSEHIMRKAETLLGICAGETTPDGKFTLAHEECLAACGTAPVLWCNDQIVENLTEEKLETFLATLSVGA